MTEPARVAPDHSVNSVVRLLIPGLGLVLLLLLTWNAARFGLGNRLTAHAASTNQFASTDAALRLSPGNPDAHYVRATILEPSNVSMAVAEYFEAVRARPDDYALWLSLARARELNGDNVGAATAARQAVSLAPYYAQPHYQLGNILLRSGRLDEGFKELRLAGASDPTLMPGIIELAWRLSSGKPEFVQRAIAPNTPEGYTALGQYFRVRHQTDAAIAMFAAAGEASLAPRQSYVGELMSAKRFKDAARVWAMGRANGALPGVMIDPGFEKESDLNEPGFGWRIGERQDGFRLSLDPANPREGRTSLKVEFTGAADQNAPMISQVVLVEPAQRYQLSFSVRAEGIVSGGLPEVIVFDPNTQTALVQSEELAKTSDGWRDYTLEFEAKPTTDAVQVIFQRRICSVSPCPIFGLLWLDAFSLRKL
jgi:Carbohydrate binding domain